MRCANLIVGRVRLLAVGKATPILSGALMLIALRYGTKKTCEIKLLARGAAGGIERLIQGGPATRLTNAENHQKEHGQENGAAEVLLHEESSEGNKLFRCEV